MPATAVFELPDWKRIHAEIDLDEPGEGRRQLAQLASALGQGIDPAAALWAIRETLTHSARRPANPCRHCGGTGLDPHYLACTSCGGWGTTTRSTTP